MFCMLVTFVVLKPLRSRLVKLLQLLNIKAMFVTLEVLKLLKSRLVKPRQPSNMPYIIVTSDVLRYCISVIDWRSDIP